MTATLARRAVIAAALVLLAVIPLASDDLYCQTVLMLTFLLAIAASGWNIMGGYAGYISLGNSAFIGIGAYTTGILAVKLGVSPFAGTVVPSTAMVVYAAVYAVVAIVIAQILFEKRDL